jgi:hypothetical protein
MTEGACRICYQWLKRNRGKYGLPELRRRLERVVERRLDRRWRALGVTEAVSSCV